MESNITPVQIQWEDVNYMVKLESGKYRILYEMN